MKNIHFYLFFVLFLIWITSQTTALSTKNYEILLPTDGVSVDNEARVVIYTISQQRPFHGPIQVVLPARAMIGGLVGGKTAVTRELNENEMSRLLSDPQGVTILKSNYSESSEGRRAAMSEYMGVLEKGEIGDYVLVGSTLTQIGAINITKAIDVDSNGVTYFTPKYPGTGTMIFQDGDTVSFTIFSEPACRIFLFAPFLKIESQPYWELVVLSLLLGIAATIVMGGYWSKKSRNLALLLCGLAPLLVGFLSTICASFSFIIPFEILGIIILALLTNQRRIIQGLVLTDNKRGKRRTETT